MGIWHTSLVFELVRKARRACRKPACDVACPGELGVAADADEVGAPVGAKAKDDEGALSLAAGLESPELSGVETAASPFTTDRSVSLLPFFDDGWLASASVAATVDDTAPVEPSPIPPFAVALSLEMGT